MCGCLGVEATEALSTLGVFVGRLARTSLFHIEGHCEHTALLRQLIIYLETHHPEFDTLDVVL